MPGVSVWHPVLLCGHLYQAQDNIRADKETVFLALHEACNDNAYYHEAVECVRRVTLSGLVASILPITAGQVIAT